MLQFVDFVSQLMRGGMKQWLSDRDWEANDVKSKLTRHKTIDFEIGFEDDFGRDAGSWQGTFLPSRLRCVKECLTLPDCVFEANDDCLQLRPRGTSMPAGTVLWKHPVTFEFEGSILSQLKKASLPDSIQAVHALLDDSTSLDLGSPQVLGGPTRSAPRQVGRSGEPLAAMLHHLLPVQRWELTNLLKQVDPHLEAIDIQSHRSGEKHLEIRQRFQSEAQDSPIEMRTEGRHINAGLLRMLAILAGLGSRSRFLWCDEIENGINPESLPFLVTHLLTTCEQVLITTQSPMLLNQLDDETAKASVIYMDRQANGQARAIPFFEIPSLRKKLEVMGPGEAFADTMLTALHDELATVLGGAH